MQNFWLKRDSAKADNPSLDPFSKTPTQIKDAYNRLFSNYKRANDSDRHSGKAPLTEAEKEAGSFDEFENSAISSSSSVKPYYTTGKTTKISSSDVNDARRTSRGKFRFQSSLESAENSETGMSSPFLWFEQELKDLLSHFTLGLCFLDDSDIDESSSELQAKKKFKSETGEATRDRFLCKI